MITFQRYFRNSTPIYPLHTNKTSCIHTCLAVLSRSLPLEVFILSFIVCKQINRLQFVVFWIMTQTVKFCRVFFYYLTCLHGVVLNQLSTATTSPFTFLLFNNTVSIKTTRLYSLNDRVINEYQAVGGMRIQNWKYLEKTYPSTTSSTTNSTWPDLGLNTDCHDGKPAIAWVIAWPYALL
jgi:hypothetical protein